MQDLHFSCTQRILNTVIYGTEWNFVYWIYTSYTLVYNVKTKKYVNKLIMVCVFVHASTFNL